MNPLYYVIYTWMGVITTYYLLLHGAYLISIFYATLELRAYQTRLRAFKLIPALLNQTLPEITLIAPAWNEAATCRDSVQSMLDLAYSNLTVMVVNDGSKDDTLKVLQTHFELYPHPRVPTGDLDTAAVRQVYRSHKHNNLWVIDKDNGGKADALNVGINHTRSPLFCCVDADTLLEPQALTDVVRPFLLNANTIASSGIIRIINGCTVENGIVTDVRMPDNWLARFQIMEYLRAFLSGRVGWSRLNALLIISGAFGLFRTDAVRQAGGYLKGTIGEDMELVVRLHHLYRDMQTPYHIAFIPDPVAWTECPIHTKDLRTQRIRWQKGLIDSLKRHRRMCLNPRFGAIGMLSYPFFVMEMLGPLVEISGYVISIFLLIYGVRLDLVIAFSAAAIGLGLIVSVSAILLEEYSLRRFTRTRSLFLLLALAFLENFGYRQLTLWWRFIGSYKMLWGGEQQWGGMTRQGLSSSQNN